MMYFPHPMDVTGNQHLWLEDIFPLMGNFLINTNLFLTPTSSGMGSDVVIVLGVIGVLVDRRFFCSWRSSPFSMCMLLVMCFLTNSAVIPGQDAQ